MDNPLTGKNFLHVAPESYYAIPNDWKLEDIKVIEGVLYHKGVQSSITAFDYLPPCGILIIDDDPESLTRICLEY